MSGIFGIVSKKNCVNLLFYGTDYHSHLGTEYGGIAVLGTDFVRQIHQISQTQFKSKFYEDIHKIQGNKGIGVISDMDEQPIFVNSKHGPFCIVTSGFIENKEELAAALLQKDISFSEVTNGGINITELVAKLITQGKNIADGIAKMFDVIQGSCSLLVLTKEGIYAARDRFGYVPLTIGQKEDSFAVTQETTAFANCGFTTVKYLEPGEIILINEDGMVQKKQGNTHEQICSFLWIYTGFPASYYDGINVEIVRENSGRLLAKRDQRDKTIDIDLVSGVPDSGTSHAIGYAQESQKPYRRPLIKYTPGYGRSYTPPSQETRDLIARMKLVSIKDIIKGKNIIVCDDSIVRGTQLKNFTIKKLWQDGAKKIHVRIACPPLMFPCKFILSTRTIQELAARRAIRSLEGHDIEDVSEYVDAQSDKHRQMVEFIKNELEVTSLKFQTVDDMISAIGLPKEKLCLYCWTGKCPGCHS